MSTTCGAAAGPLGAALPPPWPPSGGSLLRLNHQARGDAAVRRHQRPVALLIEQDARGEVAGASGVDDVGLAFLGLGLATRGELERQRRRRRQQEGERGAGEMGAGVADGLCFGVSRRGRPHANHRARRRVQRSLAAQQRLPIQALPGDDRHVAGSGSSTRCAGSGRAAARSIVTSPLIWRSGHGALVGAGRRQSLYLGQVFSPPSAARACAISCSALPSPAYRAA